MKKSLLASIPLVIIIGLLLIYFLIGNKEISQSPDITTNKGIQESQTEKAISIVEYTHPSGKFSYNYPKTWEFVPKREDMGLRPKEYTGYSKNEIVTVLYFKDKGSDLKSWAKTFDGGYDEDWIEKEVFNKNALFYNYSSDKLDNIIYYFGNGTDAVKVMFSKYYAFGPEGQQDNSRFKDDFDLILESFKFN